MCQAQWGHSEQNSVPALLGFTLQGHKADNEQNIINEMYMSSGDGC